MEFIFTGRNMSTGGKDESAELVRRPISSRDTRWAVRAAAILADKGVKPNLISIASRVFGKGVR